MLRIVPHTVPRVGRSYEHFPDGFELHLLLPVEAPLQAHLGWLFRGCLLQTLQIIECVYHKESMSQRVENRDLLTDVLALSFAVTNAFRFSSTPTSLRPSMIARPQSPWYALHSAEKKP